MTEGQAPCVGTPTEGASASPWCPSALPDGCSRPVTRPCTPLCCPLRSSWPHGAWLSATASDTDVHGVERGNGGAERPSPWCGDCVALLLCVAVPFAIDVSGSPSMNVNTLPSSQGFPSPGLFDFHPDQECQGVWTFFLCAPDCPELYPEVIKWSSEGGSESPKNSTINKCAVRHALGWSDGVGMAVGEQVLSL